MNYIDVLTERLESILKEAYNANEIVKSLGNEIPSTFILLYEHYQKNTIEFVRFPIYTENESEKRDSIKSLLLTLDQSKSIIRPILLISIINAWYLEKTKEELETQDIKNIKVSEDPKKKSCILVSAEINNKLITLMKGEEDNIKKIIDEYDPNRTYGDFQFILKTLKK